MGGRYTTAGKTVNTIAVSVVRLWPFERGGSACCAGRSGERPFVGSVLFVVETCSWVVRE